MLKPRIMPCLLIHKGGLVKTTRFKDPKYVGDPLNAVRIFNEKNVDELMVLDIDATALNKEPDYRLISNMAAECRMPLCYGGGVKTLEQAKRILSLGVEKVAISAAGIEDPSVLQKLSQEVGSQSVVLVLDLKKKLFGSSYDVFTHNGKRKSKKSLADILKNLSHWGIGELVINSLEQDGVMQGYDEKLIQQVYPHVSIPLTALGGAGSLSDIHQLIERYHIIGCAAGSLFVFKGKYRAVLINYPKPEEKAKLASAYETID